MQRRFEVALLTLILVLSLGVRVWGVAHKIFTDENKVVVPALKMTTLGGFPLLHSAGYRYPHLFPNILALLYWPLSLIGDGVETHMHYIIARTLTALFGIGTVYFTYIIGKQLVGTFVGLLAAFFLALLPLHVKYSHYAHLDVRSGDWHCACFCSCNAGGSL
jgi:4-amino-4-deoxy-L-arabinose transferase-like glycosyltransferase